MRGGIAFLCTAILFFALPAVAQQQQKVTDVNACLSSLEPSLAAEIRRSRHPYRLCRAQQARQAQASEKKNPPAVPSLPPGMKNHRLVTPPQTAEKTAD